MLQLSDFYINWKSLFIVGGRQNQGAKHGQRHCSLHPSDTCPHLQGGTGDTASDLKDCSKES